MKIRWFWYRDLTLREKATLFTLLFIGNGIGSLALARNVSKYFVIQLILGTYIFGWCNMSLKCPKCGTPKAKNELFLFGINTHMWLPFPKKNCSECGTKID